jgi:predicted CXXCH cytochrome family protein
VKPRGLARATLAIALVAAGRGDERGKLMRPLDGAALPPGEISIVARAPNGSIELDGKPLAAEKPFPGVLQARTTPAPGPHRLALVWDSGRQEIRFFVGPGAPPEFKPYRVHPPVAAACTQCHGLSKRGRFRFQGGCFDCHKQDAFPRTHNHTPDVLVECGECHNAHGSTERALLLLAREKACKLCHN